VRCLCLLLFTTVAAPAGAGVFTRVTGDTRVRHEDREHAQHPHRRHKFEQRFRGRAGSNPEPREHAKERRTSRFGGTTGRPV
jgi:hypothetical protein